MLPILYLYVSQFTISHFTLAAYTNLLPSQFISSSSSSIFIYFTNSLMDSQQKSVYNYSQQMESTKQTPISSQQTTAITSVVSNMKRNGIDLSDELRMQGWETYFRRLYGLVYTYLVKEFWRFADSDDHYIVSHVLRIKIVITEKSIASLLNMEKTWGRRIYNINPRAEYMSQEISLTIFQQNAKENSSKNKELHQNLRVWMKIILGTIHHLPASNSYDYINTDQKCILYCLHKGLKLNLQALLFKYLRDSISKTQETT